MSYDVKTRYSFIRDLLFDSTGVMFWRIADLFLVFV